LASQAEQASQAHLAKSDHQVLPGFLLVQNKIKCNPSNS